LTEDEFNRIQEEVLTEIDETLIPRNNNFTPTDTQINTNTEIMHLQSSQKMSSKYGTNMSLNLSVRGNKLRKQQKLEMFYKFQKEYPFKAKQQLIDMVKQ